MYKTYYPKKEEIESSWYIVDANGENLGRLATRIATVLMGKHKPTFTPGVEMGDYVIVTNASGITVTGTRTNSKLDTKKYYRHSGYPGGFKTRTLRQLLETYPDRVIRSAVWGMLPHNKRGRSLLKRLRVFATAEHPHSAQNPEPLK
ncbi:MAG: 50S ribosomal protein L13 [Anaerolineae bacterium]|nr:50S ribosomal protein L13 [Anaerolineae bacterium]MBT3713492.1 50S ribosomal protein L13 [Anaerolineae bacterium]MBT4312104.1 50S ribosomal protein L13 [Anaerolineae bacterium]MBT4457155.1 50S ribosomal protein L13 [Anaerolineae bacterium]MBT4843088.1 50S ribosomal protein L13 [Anaerolineae bacterium]